MSLCPGGKYVKSGTNRTNRVEASPTCLGRKAKPGVGSSALRYLQGRIWGGGRYY